MLHFLKCQVITFKIYPQLYLKRDSDAAVVLINKAIQIHNKSGNVINIITHICGIELIQMSQNDIRLFLHNYMF